MLVFSVMYFPLYNKLFVNFETGSHWPGNQFVDRARLEFMEICIFLLPKCRD